MDDERTHLAERRAKRLEQQGSDVICQDCDDWGPLLRCADGGYRCKACTLLFERKDKE